MVPAHVLEFAGFFVTLAHGCVAWLLAGVDDAAWNRPLVTARVAAQEDVAVVVDSDRPNGCEPQQGMPYAGAEFGNVRRDRHFRTYRSGR